MRKSMPGHELLPSSLLTLTTLERGDTGWTAIANGPDHARCPRCRHVSTARHSWYVRTLKDLPTAGAPVSLRVRVGRWRCRQPGCEVCFFTGALPGVAGAYGRRTSRAEAVTDTYDVEAVERWFSAHPLIHTICRDRNGRYASSLHAADEP